jgi:hypothetical protein
MAVAVHMNRRRHFMAHSASLLLVLRGDALL